METMELNRESRPVCLLHRLNRTVIVLLIIVCLPVTTFAVSVAEGQESAREDDVQSRALKDIQMPTWPQKWIANNREPAGFGFGLTQPGLVTVDVQSQGAPIVVELSAVGAPAVQRQTGSGASRLTYQLTPADIQRSALWQVQISLAQTGGPPAQATGTIVVQHPPADPNIVRAQIQGLRGRSSSANPEKLMGDRTEMDAVFEAAKAQFEQEKAARHAALMAKVQPHINAAQAQAKAAIRPRGVEADPMASPESPVPADGDVSSRALSPGTTLITPQMKIAIPPPSITSLSVTEGESLDPIIINGNGFSPSPGEIHFIVGPGLDLVGSIASWTDTQIIARIPSYQGIASPVMGNIFVVRHDDLQRSPAVPFKFIPELVIGNLTWPPAPIDSLVSYPNLTAQNAPPGWFFYWYGPSYTYKYWFVSVAQAGLFGYKGNDQFYMNKRLKNGWVVTSVGAYVMWNSGENPGVAGFSPNRNVYVADSRIGTDSPYVNVRVWEQPFVSTNYTVGVVIKGPKGVPFE